MGDLLIFRLDQLIVLLKLGLELDNKLTALLKSTLVSPTLFFLPLRTCLNLSNLSNLLVHLLCELLNRDLEL